jgi:peptidoglycan hydrolase-like protein with peptidoglycan-binding domain
MKRVMAAAWLLALTLVAAPAAAQSVAVTPELVREVQFMLHSIGIDPGPIDGIPRQRTNGALRQFEESRHLPAAELQSRGTLPGAVLAALRAEAARAVLGPPPAPVAPAPPPPAAKPPAPAPDRFAACTHNPADFHIGGQDYTPESYLQQAFQGSTERAVASLTQRLSEARQIAQSIGPSADREVERQARVLGYYQCRLKIEQAASGK